MSRFINQKASDKLSSCAAIVHGSAVCLSQPDTPIGVYCAGRSYGYEICARGRSRTKYARVYPLVDGSERQLKYGVYETMSIEEFENKFKPEIAVS